MTIDWDTYFRHELFHRRHAPVDFRRWKRASQRALREMHPGAVRVLDATAGLGDHTVNLAELGFVTEACDASAVARTATAASVKAAKLDVAIHDARWETLGTTLGQRFDLVFNDAIHWIEDPATMDAALRGTLSALVPGGALVFFFADARMSEPGAGMKIRAWDEEHLARHELAWRHDDHSHLVVRAPAADHVDEHHLYLEGTKLESVVMRRIYRWDWHAMREALLRAGFESVRSDVFVNDHGSEVALNRAFRARSAEGATPVQRR